MILKLFRACRIIDARELYYYESIFQMEVI